MYSSKVVTEMRFTSNFTFKRHKSKKMVLYILCTLDMRLRVGILIIEKINSFFTKFKTSHYNFS